MKSSVAILSSPSDPRLAPLRDALATCTSWRIVHEPEPLRVLHDRSVSLALLPLQPGVCQRVYLPLANLLGKNGWSLPIVPVLTGPGLEDELASMEPVPDFLSAPFEPHDVCLRLGRLLFPPARRPATRLSENGLGPLAKVVGEAPAFVEVKAKIPAIAESEAIVMIVGETGTGKGVAAHAIHTLSRRSAAPFVPINCGAVPAELFENELFGHRHGAFTHATRSDEGLIAQAQGGTLFLDEVDAIPLQAQVKLLQFLQDKTYRPLGAARLRYADVRIIAASNALLEERVAEGLFREDLFYRLNVIPLTLPPLRDRPSDVPLLARHFLGKFVAEGEQAPWDFDAGVLACLQHYAWPGNIRELENLIRQLVALGQPRTLRCSDLPRHFARVVIDEPGSYQEAKALAIEAFERQYALRMLALYEGNITQAARAARKDRRAFGKLVKKHCLRDQAPTLFSAGSKTTQVGLARPALG